MTELVTITQWKGCSVAVSVAVTVVVESVVEGEEVVMSVQTESICGETGVSADYQN